MKNLKKYIALLMALLITVFQLPFSVFATSDMEKVEIENISIIEGTNGYMATDYNPDTENWDLEYYRYGYCPAVTVTLKDGTVLNDYGGITYNEEWYSLSYTDDQSYENQWGVGAHTVTASLLGVETTFEVEIVENPVEKVEVENISPIEETNGYMDTAYNPDTESWDLEYYRYGYCPAVTVTFKDGTVLNDYGGITYNEKWYSLSYIDDQSYENQWGVGTHTVTASLLGVEATFEVEIVESPYILLEIVEVKPLKENENCYVNDNGDTIYYQPTFFFRVTSKDGSYFIASSRDDENIAVAHDQESNPWTVGGNNRFTVYYANLTTEASVELQASSDFEFIEQNGGVYITDYRAYGKENLAIPSQIDGKPVIGLLSLGDNASYLKSITVPDSVTTIGDSAFSRAYQLETLTLGSGVNYLNVDMFYGCDAVQNIFVSKDNPNYCDLDGIVYDKQMTTLIVYPFAKDENYTVPASVSDIDILNKSIYDFINVSYSEDSTMFVTVDGVTYNADKTKVIICNKNKSGNYVMPDTVIDIAENAFNGCSELTGVTMSKNVTSIVYGAFADCSSLMEVSLPSQLTAIDDYAFAGCSQLDDINFPSSLKTIGENAFSYSGLKAISLPDSVEDIGNCAFVSCEELESVQLSNSLSYLSDGMFAGCHSLAAISIPPCVNDIGASTFAGCNSLTSISIPSSVNGIGAYAFARCSLTSITIPDNVTYLGSGAFNDCNKLENITLGKGLTEISSYAFSNCGFKMLCIPDNITKIGSGAFSDCLDLSDVEFTNNEVEIGAYAFSHCPIKELNLPNGIKNAGEKGAFASTDISKISFPESVTSIAYANFANCSKLSEIDIPSSVISIGGHAFDDTPWYASRADGEVYLEHVFYSFKGNMPANTEITIKDDITVISDYAFEDRENLKKLTLPEGLKAIGSWAFYDCTSLTEINIPASVTQIDISAFAGCSSLTSINVSSDNPNYKSVDGVLFNKDGSELLWCPKREIERYEVPDDVLKIATGAFSDSGVTEIKIMNPTTELCEYSVGYRSMGHHGRGNFSSDSFGGSGGSFEYNFTEIICLENSKAYTYAKENDMLAIASEKIELETEDKDVTISGTSDVISEDAVINVELKSSDEISISETDNDKYNFETAVVFDISLQIGNVKVQPRSKLTVSISVPETLDGTKCRVLYIDESGDVTDMNATYQNNRMTFETDHFSNYMIVETDSILGDLNGDGTVDSDDAIYLLYHTFLSQEYPVQQDCDFDKNGVVDSDDAIYLLYHTFLPEEYPLS